MNVRRYQRDEREKLVFWQSLGVAFWVLAVLTVISSGFFEYLFSDSLNMFYLNFFLSFTVALWYQFLQKAYFFVEEPNLKGLAVGLFCSLLIGYLQLNISLHPSPTDKIGDRFSYVGLLVLAVSQMIFYIYFFRQQKKSKKLQK